MYIYKLLSQGDFQLKPQMQEDFYSLINGSLSPNPSACCQMLRELSDSFHFTLPPWCGAVVALW